MPLIRSMQRANVGNLTVADVDLTNCRFAGAHRLDGLRLDGFTPFAPRPKGTLTNRRTIVEERYLRDLTETKYVTASGVARTYRALRKGREDNKDAPGAAPTNGSAAEVCKSSDAIPLSSWAEAIGDSLASRGFSRAAGFDIPGVLKVAVAP